MIARLGEQNMNPRNFLTIAMYVVMAYLIIRMFLSSKRNGKNRLIIDAVKNLEDKEVYFAKVDELIHQINDPEFVNKGIVLKLWGLAYHNDVDSFEEVLNTLDVKALIEDKKGVVSIDINEDSFFYLYLAIPNMLHHIGRDDLRTVLRTKMSEYDTLLDKQMSKELSAQFDKFYDGQDDRGQVFYESLMEGEYEGYIYSKTMISIYKNLANAVLYKIYQDQAKFDQLEEMKPMLENFNQSNVGRRWVRNLDIQLDSDDDHHNEDDKQDDTQEPSQENLSETMVLEKLTDADTKEDTKE